MDQDPDRARGSLDPLRIGLFVFFVLLIGIAVALLVLPTLHF